MSAEEQIVLLGLPGRSTYFKWKQSPGTARLGRYTLKRLLLLLGIYKTLQILLPQPNAADSWIKRPNSSAAPFGGRRALDRMLAGNVSDLVVACGSISTQCEAAGRDTTAMAGPLAHCAARLVARLSGHSNTFSGHQSVRPGRFA